MSCQPPQERRQILDADINTYVFGVAYADLRNLQHRYPSPPSACSNITHASKLYLGSTTTPGVAGDHVRRNIFTGRC